MHCEEIIGEWTTRRLLVPALRGYCWYLHCGEIVGTCTVRRLLVPPLWGDCWYLDCEIVGTSTVWRLLVPALCGDYWYLHCKEIIGTCTVWRLSVNELDEDYWYLNCEEVDSWLPWTVVHVTLGGGKPSGGLQVTFTSPPSPTNSLPPSLGSKTGPSLSMSEHIKQ